jgi:hypothetical protein
MPNRHQGPNIPHPKRRGEWAELRFQLRATEQGLILARPCGDCAPYDFLVACPERAITGKRACPERAISGKGACPERANSDRRGHFLRVQVKCTVYRRGNSYKCHLDHNGIPYTPTEIDLFAAYVIPADTFYILPLAATHNQPDILLSPHRPNSKYSQYKEAWHLLMQELP